MNRSAHQVDGLEVIRGLSALLVVYNHLFLFGLLPKIGPIALPAQYATESVIIFFVLSGLVITLANDRQQLNESAYKRFSRFWHHRLVRIYPNFILGVFLAYVAAYLKDKSLPSRVEFTGTVIFLSSLGAEISPVPTLNPPLWSLTNEMFYYLVFSMSILFKPVIVLWFFIAGLAAWLYPLDGRGVGPLIAALLALSPPWLIGWSVAKFRDRIPVVSTAFGIACFLISLVFARCSMTTNYYDPFRLTAFAFCCAPLFASLVQQTTGDDQLTDYRAVRVVLASLSIVLLWTTSSSLFTVKVALSTVAVAAAIMPLSWINATLGTLRPLRSLLIYIGSISYALYVLHSPLIYLTKQFVPETAAPLPIVIFCVAAFGASHIMERVVQPWMRATSTRTWRR